MSLTKEEIQKIVADELVEKLKPHKTIDRLLQDTMVAINTKDILPEDETLLRTIENKILQLRGNVEMGGKEFKDYNANELSLIAGDLAIYKVNLGELHARVDFYREMSEQYAKVKEASFRNIATEQATTKKTLREGKDAKAPTQDDIKAELKLLMLPANAIFAVRQEFSTRCLYLWRSLNSLLDVIEQRIRVLCSERSDLKHYDNNLSDHNIKEEFFRKEQEFADTASPNLSAITKEDNTPIMEID